MGDKNGLGTQLRQWFPMVSKLCEFRKKSDDLSGFNPLKEWPWGPIWMTILTQRVPWYLLRMAFGAPWKVRGRGLGKQWWLYEPKH